MPKPLNRKSAGIASNRPVKVLQFGEGNFLRAFADWIIDLLNERTNFNGDVRIIQPLSKGTGEMINKQDGLYHVVLNGILNGKPTTVIRLIQCVRGVVNPYEDFEGYLRTAENPDLQIIISNTTEAGIAFHPDDTNPEKLPSSFPGKLTVLLYHRFKFFSGAPGKALTLIPCELIDRNGQKLRDTIIQYIRLWDLPDAFLNWIQHHTTFCNTLVDRIVPGFPKETITQIQDAIGFEDNLVVVAEPFHLWVIEGPDQVGQLMPAADAGLDVLFVKDQTPYRTRKVRILNGAHTSLVPVAYLHGLRTVREAVEDPFAGTFLKEAIEQEIIPTLDLPEKELRQFAHSVLERFRNPFIKHELSAIALNSISKYKVRVLPSILEYVSRKGKLPERLLYSLACLIRFYKGEWRGEALPVNDDPAILQRFEEAWQSGDVAYVASGILSDTELWDTDLTHIPGVTERVSAHLEMLQSQNIEAAWAGKP